MSGQSLKLGQFIFERLFWWNRGEERKTLIYNDMSCPPTIAELFHERIGGEKIQQLAEECLPFERWDKTRETRPQQTVPWLTAVLSDIGMAAAQEKGTNNIVLGRVKTTPPYWTRVMVLENAVPELSPDDHTALTVIKEAARGGLEVFERCETEHLGLWRAALELTA